MKQDLKINVQTGYDGKGINQTSAGLENLRGSINKTSQDLGRLGGSFGKLGGVMSKAQFLFGSFGGQLGVLGQTVGGLAGTVGGLTSSFGLLANPVTIGIAAVTGLYKAADYFTTKAEKAKEAAANLRKEMHRLRVAAEIARETAEDNREAKRAKKLEESQKKANELATALWKVHDAEKARQLAGNDLKRQTIQQKTADAMDAERDPAKKELIGAEGALTLARFNGTEAVKKAVQTTRDEIAKLKTLTNQIGKDGVDPKMLNTQITAQRKNVETARIREQIARDKMDADVKAAEIKVKDAKIEYEGAQARKEIDRDEKAYQKMIDDDLKASEEAQKERDEKAFNKASENQAMMEEKLASLDRQIAQARKSVDKIAARRETIQRGMVADKTGFEYSTDSNGNLTDAGQVARARRYAERADRDAASQRMGENATRARQERMYDLLAKRDTPGGLSRREQRELGDLQAWDDQFNGGKAAKDKLENLQDERNQTEKDMLEELKKISALADKLGLK